MSVSLACFLPVLLLLSPPAAGSPSDEGRAAARAGEVVIHEIHYHPSPDFDAGDWVELYNAGDAAVDLSGWSLRDDDATHLYFLPQGTTLPPSGYLVVVRDDSAFASRHPDVGARVGPFEFGLDSAGDQVRLFDAAGRPADSVAFDNAAPWPVAPDGNGPTLELKDPAADNALPGSWAPSRFVGGTPGAANSVRSDAGPSDPVVVTEISYNPLGISNPEDWIELYNPNPGPVDLSGWTLWDRSSAYTLPPGTAVQPGAYLVLARDVVAFETVHFDVPGVVGPFGFGLDNAGDVVQLFDAGNFLIDEVAYEDNPPWPPQADGSGRTLELRAPGLDNRAPENWQASRELLGTPGATNSSPDPYPNAPRIVVNEISYHSIAAFDPGDWIELYNPNAQEVELSGWWFQDGVDANAFAVPAGTVIPADGYLVLVSDSAAFAPLHPGVDGFVGDFSFNLSNGGEQVRLYNADGVLADSLTYDDAEPWPVEADGSGRTLELMDPSRDNARALYWAASVELGGSPGRKNGAFAVSVGDEAPSEALHAIEAVYPNPARGEARVAYRLPASGRVALRVYDVTGRLVATLRDGLLPPGRYEAVWSPERTAGAGLYVAELVVDGVRRDVRRLVLLR